MRLAEWRARFQGPTLLVAPLGWDCFGKDEFEIPVRKRLVNPESSGILHPKTNSVRVRTVG